MIVVRLEDEGCVTLAPVPATCHQDKLCIGSSGASREVFVGFPVE
jgi:hypothetical protein